MAWILAVALIARLALDLSLAKAGFYYGEDPDSFWRLGLAWQWAMEPFFTTYHWPPLQFVLVGSTFALLKPLGLSASMNVPAIWNHVFFLCSLAFTYLAAERMGGVIGGISAAVVAVTLTEDIWTTFSGLSEPITIACFAVVAWCLLESLQGNRARRWQCLKLAGIAAGIASANHYLGWSLVPVVAIWGVRYAIRHASRGLEPGWKAYVRPAGPVLVSIVFPFGWMAANYLQSGDPLHFLTRATSYHLWATDLSTAAKLAAVPDVLWRTSPLLIALAVPSLLLVFLQRRAFLVTLLPVAAYFSFLTISSLESYGVPTMHNRYALVPAWLLIPFVAFLVSTLFEQGWPTGGLATLLLLVPLAAHGVIRVYSFDNSVEPTTRAVAELLQNRLRDADARQRIVMEDEACAGQVVGVANGISRPDWVRTIPTKDLQRMVQNTEGRLPKADLLVATNPVTQRAVSAHYESIATIGDYWIARASEGGEPARAPAPIPAPWHLINQSAYHSRDHRGVHYFAFDPAPVDAGDAVGLEASLPVEPNGCRILRAEVEDRYQPDSYPWAAVQQLVVNGVVLWSHDLSLEGVCGWRPIDTYLMATGSRLEIQLRVVALTGPDLPIDWRLLSLTGIRNLTISECP